MPRKVRDYKAEYKSYHSKPEQIANRTARNKARKEYEEANGPLPSNVDVDHKTAMSKGGTNAKSNLRAVPKSANRSFARNPDGSMKSQTSGRERKR